MQLVATIIVSHEQCSPLKVSLAGQPLLTQKVRKGLVNGVTSVCLQVEYMNYQ